MRVNQQAQALTPGLFDPSSMFIGPNTQLGVDQFNAGNINSVNRANAGFQNDANVQNTSLANSILQQQITNSQAAASAQNQQVAAAASTLSGLASTLGQQNQNRGNFYGSQSAAQNSIGQYGGTVTNSQYGYAIRPDIVG